ncbi:electron transfer flavoprotein-ubiquinone oxidoreductase [Besnoitia besnoiti]|uniref:electron-transferring-flavoprotein dehydrogenase n=1 Tax=Besnoitia besnoiti TaxID=94643 RepID=A0A2A9MDS5_BESBE|nr:electron transfer flavoprotein-ubiquinone oxidoreductase [Besnoitia besnoiti]PFH36658.1 electron transfer flavoprotein-ubiquinone oxidoreductase [Besnoitia besnoiti]
MDNLSRGWGRRSLAPAVRSVLHSSPLSASFVAAFSSPPSSVFLLSTDSRLVGASVFAASSPFQRLQARSTSCVGLSPLFLASPSSGSPHFAPLHLARHRALASLVAPSASLLFCATPPSASACVVWPVPASLGASRRFASASSSSSPVRERMHYDVLVVGGGPAGLAAAIRLKQKAEIAGRTDFSVCLIDKGAEIGSHILSGNVFEPRALDELLPGWRTLLPSSASLPDSSASSSPLAGLSSPFKDAAERAGGAAAAALYLQDQVLKFRRLLREESPPAEPSEKGKSREAANEPNDAAALRGGRGMNLSPQERDRSVQTAAGETGGSGREGADLIDAELHGTCAQGPLQREKERGEGGAGGLRRVEEEADGDRRRDQRGGSGKAEPKGEDEEGVSEDGGRTDVVGATANEESAEVKQIEEFLESLKEKEEDAVFDKTAMRTSFIVAEEGIHEAQARRREAGSIASDAVRTAGGPPVRTVATEDEFLVFFNNRRALELPMWALPQQMKNAGKNFIISLGELANWLAEVAEQHYGVEIYPGFAGADLLVKASKASEPLPLSSFRKDISDSSSASPPHLSSSTTPGPPFLAASFFSSASHPSFSFEAGARPYVCGVRTADMGVKKDGSKSKTFTPGIDLFAKQVVLAEGCRGSLAELAIAAFNLRGEHALKNRAGKSEEKKKHCANTLKERASAVLKGIFTRGKLSGAATAPCPQQYGLGLKEIWEVKEENHRKGKVVHSVGWPLGLGDYGGGFLYHTGDANRVLLGFVVGLDYKNPFLNPYEEFQRWKTHPRIASVLQGGQCVSYGARCLDEGGFQAMPSLTFPGGLLVGGCAGFLSAPKLKGTHLAMKSGMEAAEALADAFLRPSSSSPPSATGSESDGQGSAGETALNGGEADADAREGLEVKDYETRVRRSWAVEELYEVRNAKPCFQLGLLPGLLGSFFHLRLTRGREPWTLRWSKEDRDYTENADLHKSICYPPHDSRLTFSLLDNLVRSGTTHAHDQPSHLVVRRGMEDVPIDVSLRRFAGPEGRFCPAGVYEYVEEDSDLASSAKTESSSATAAPREKTTATRGGMASDLRRAEGTAQERKGKKPKKMRLQINAQNCLHCKGCAIKTTQNFIEWTVPEGGGGPRYSGM